MEWIAALPFAVVGIAAVAFDLWVRYTIAHSLKRIADWLDPL